MNQNHPWCWLWKPGNCVPRMPSSSKGNSYFSQEPSYNLPGLPEKFKDFADSSINHCDFFFSQGKLQVQLRFDEPLASWLKKKQHCQAGKLRCTKLSSKSPRIEKIWVSQRHTGFLSEKLGHCRPERAASSLCGQAPASKGTPTSSAPSVPSAGSLPDRAQVSYEQNLSNEQTTNLFVVVRIRMSPFGPIYLKA